MSGEHAEVNFFWPLNLLPGLHHMQCTQGRVKSPDKLPALQGKIRGTIGKFHLLLLHLKNSKLLNVLIFD